ncbi:MAG TPA: radical SAM family heme chaperone HemW [Candidatus Tumulicola sp.]
MLGIYVHLPFCPYICPYCDFAKWPWRASQGRRYLAALEREIEATPADRAATLFLGGGTPNAYDAESIQTLVRRLTDRFGPFDEASIEVNPELVTPGDFARYVDAGITRVSIGVQSFEPAEIATLGRKHTIDQVRNAVRGARASGMRSVSLDLMFAVPGQTPQSWQRSLHYAVDTGVDHVSCYGLTIESGTPFAGWLEREPAAFFDDTAEAEFYRIAIDELSSAGFEQYEISNFARPGHRCAHNENYWANGDYIGLGVGAASFRDEVRKTNTRSFDEYIQAVERGTPIPAESERLGGFRRAGEAIMLALRTAEGFELEPFRTRYGVDVERHYAPVLRRYASDGLLERGGGRVRLTERGRFLANEVCGAFVTFD